MRPGEVEAGGELGGVGDVELEEAVGVGGTRAEVLPGLQVAAGLDVKVFAGQTLRLQKDVANAQELDGSHYIGAKKVSKGRTDTDMLLVVRPKIPIS